MAVKQDLLDAIKKAQNNIPTQEGQDPETIQIIKKVRYYLTTLRTNVECMDENLINTCKEDYTSIMGSLNEISSNLQGLGNDSSHFYDINEYMWRINESFSKIYLFPYDYNKTVIENNKTVQDSFDAMVSYVDEQQNSLKTKFSDVQKTANTLQQTLEQHKKNIDTIINDTINDTNNHFNTAFDTIQQKANTLQQTLEQHKEHIDTIINDTINDTNNRFNTAYDKQMNTADQSQKRLNAQLEQYRKEIHKKHQEILKLTGVVAGDTYSAEYNKNADTEKESANSWRKMTIYISMGSLSVVGVLAYALLQNIPSEISNSMILYKFSIGFPVLFLAYYLINYSSKQSKYHREKEAYYRDFALKSKSIDPYISALKDDLQQLLKTYVAGELFTSIDNKTSHKTEIKNGFTKEILNKITSLMNKNSGSV